MQSDALAAGPDGRPRCFWAVGGAAEYVSYHDEEWGRPVLTDDGLFERLTLEAFQSGLSWLTILRKRPAFRAAFADFHVAAVAAFGDADRDRLMADAGIVRNRLKVEAALANARAALPVIEEHGSLAAFFWRFRPRGARAPRVRDDWVAVSPESKVDGQGAQEAWLSLRRADDRLLADAGGRHRQRPRRRVLRARRGRPPNSGGGGALRLTAAPPAAPQLLHPTCCPAGWREAFRTNPLSCRLASRGGGRRRPRHAAARQSTEGA